MDLNLAARDGVTLAATLFEPSDAKRRRHPAEQRHRHRAPVLRSLRQPSRRPRLRRADLRLSRHRRLGEAARGHHGRLGRRRSGLDDRSSRARSRPARARAVIGHSFGGQVLGLADNIGELSRRRADLQPERPLAALAARPPAAAHAGAVVAADSRPHRRDRPLSRLWIGTANLPAGIARSWARWGRSPPLCLRPARPAAPAAQRRRRVSACAG